MVAIIAVLSLYWAVLFRVEQNMGALVVHVVDFDGQVAPFDNVNPVIGPGVRQVVEEIRQGSQPSLGYVIKTPQEFGNDPLAVRQAVYDWDSWAAIVVNPNATALLQQAVETGNSSYDPSGAVQMIIQTARDESTVSQYIVPQMQQFSKRFSSSFGPMWSQMIMSNTSLSRENLASASAAVNPAVAPLQYDLRPFQPAVVTPAVSIGLIYLIIMAFFSFSFFLPIHMVSSSGVPRIARGASLTCSRNTSNRKATRPSIFGSSSSGGGSLPSSPTYSFPSSTRSYHWPSRSTSPRAHPAQSTRLPLRARLRTATEASPSTGCSTLSAW